MNRDLRPTVGARRLGRLALIPAALIRAALPCMPGGRPTLAAAIVSLAYAICAPAGLAASATPDALSTVAERSGFRLGAIRRRTGREGDAASHPEVARAFNQRLAADPDFAKSPDARLEFFYRRHPFWDKRQNLYPILRIATPRP